MNTLSLKSKLNKPPFLPQLALAVALAVVAVVASLPSDGYGKEPVSYGLYEWDVFGIEFPYNGF